MSGTSNNGRNGYNIPKKINRHVLKAVSYLTKTKGSASTSDILYQVKYQMRNLVPVSNADTHIFNSLQALDRIRMINRVDSNHYMLSSHVGPMFGLDEKTTDPPNYFAPYGERPKSSSALDPNRKRARISEESISGDEYDHARKRLRTTRNIVYKGRKINLPNVRTERMSNESVVEIMGTEVTSVVEMTDAVTNVNSSNFLEVASNVAKSKDSLIDNCEEREQLNTNDKCTDNDQSESATAATTFSMNVVKSWPCCLKLLHCMGAVVKYQEDPKH